MATDVYLGLGSNVGARERHLAFGLRELERVGPRTGVSGVYESDPVGYLDQGRFLNMVVRMATPLAPEALLDVLQGIETAAGRERTIAQGPRTLDIDVLLYGRSVIDSGALTVPHPRMAERPFVLVPLLELDGRLADPRTGRAYRDHLEELVRGMPDGAPSAARRPEPRQLAEAVGLRWIMDGEELLDEGER